MLLSVWSVYDDIVYSVDRGALAKCLQSNNELNMKFKRANKSSLRNVCHARSCANDCLLNVYRKSEDTETNSI